MAKKKPSNAHAHSGKLIVIGIMVLVAAAAAYGYFAQTSHLRDSEAEVAATLPAAANATAPATPATPAATPANTPAASTTTPAGLLQPKADDIIVGSATAPVIIVEYASLSCPHCAHFYTDVLPQLKKEYLDTGKAKLAFRHFPLNAPALKGALLVDCAAPAQRPAFLKTLFATQDSWAFSPDYEQKLKKIAATGGIDAAQFDRCMADKKLEERILATRMEGEQSFGVDATPSFFVQGRRIEGEATIDALRKAIESQ